MNTRQAVNDFLEYLAEKFGAGAPWTIPKDEKRRQMALDEWEAARNTATVAEPEPPVAAKSQKTAKKPK